MPHFFIYLSAMRHANKQAIHYDWHHHT